MEFQKEHVFTALNADELKVGSKCIFANSPNSLKRKVKEGTDIRPIVQILNDTYERRFKTDVRGEYPFAYLVSEQEEKNWIVYIHRSMSDPKYYYLTACREDAWESVQKDYDAKTKLFVGTEKEVDDWYTSRKHLSDVIAAWEDGRTIQYNSGNGWEDYCDNKPAWDVTSEYRIKPEGLKWTDLKLGDVICHNGIFCMITSMCGNDTTNFHVCFNGNWHSDSELEDWEKVE